MMMQINVFSATTGQLIERDMTLEEVAAWEAEQASLVPSGPQPYRLYKFVFIQRWNTDPELGLDEASMLEGALAAEEPKMRQMFNAAEYFMSDDSLFAYLHWIVAIALGSEEEPNFDRADQLLAPEA